MTASCTFQRALPVMLAGVALLTGPGVSDGATVNVSTWPQLWDAVVARQPGDEIVLAPGEYNVTNCLYMSNCAGLIMRGSTGNPHDVILSGPGLNDPSGGTYECFQFVSPDMTLRDLTIRDFYYHGIHFQDAGDRCVADNVIVHDNGEHYIKGSPGSDDIIIRNCKLYQEVPPLNGMPDRPDNFVGGIDLPGASRAQVHDNLVLNIHGAGDDGDGGIFLKDGAQDCIVERNVIIGGSKGIQLGYPMDLGLWQVKRSIVRNNFVLSRPDEDIGVELCSTSDCKVYNNTVYRTGYPNIADWWRTFHIWDTAAFPTTNLDIRNNIVRGRIFDQSSGDWSDSAVAAMGNIVYSETAVPTEWFVDPANLDLHLTEHAWAAIDAGVPLADVPYDIDGDARPFGSTWDMGADEWIPEPATLSLLALGGSALIRRRRKQVRVSDT